MRTLDCGHEVPESEAVRVPEVVICRECYRPFDLEDYPRVLDSGKRHAGTTRHGVAKTVTYRTRLIGLDKYGRGVYHCEKEKRILHVGPFNDREFDVPEDARPLRVRHTKPEPAPAPFHPDFHTFPDGDHLAIIDSYKIEAGYADGWRLAEWAVDRIDRDPDVEGFELITERMADLIRRHGKIDTSYLDSVEVVELD